MADRKLEVEANLTCPKCGGVPYRLFRRQTTPGSDVYENIIWPTEPGVMPPESNSNLRCPKCDAPLERK